MLITYYAVAIITKGVYSRLIILRWRLFALLTPLFACMAWTAKEPGALPKVISIGIVLASALSSVLLFDRLRWYDFVIDALLVYELFFKKVDRQSPAC